jgi:NAD(P)H-nitrite reductase large subunit
MTTICYCFSVSKEDIEERIEAGDSLDTIRNSTGLGFGCGGCNRVVERIWGEEATEESRAFILNAITGYQS